MQDPVLVSIPPLGSALPPSLMRSNQTWGCRLVALTNTLLSLSSATTNICSFVFSRLPLCHNWLNNTENTNLCRNNQGNNIRNKKYFDVDRQYFNCDAKCLFWQNLILLLQSIFRIGTLLSTSRVISWATIIFLLFWSHINGIQILSRTPFNFWQIHPRSLWRKTHRRWLWGFRSLLLPCHEGIALSLVVSGVTTTTMLSPGIVDVDPRRFPIWRKGARAAADWRESPSSFLPQKLKL